MASRLQGDGGRVALLGRREPSVGVFPLRLVDRDESLRVLRQNLAGPTTMADVRRWTCQPGTSCLTDAALLRDVADRITARSLRLERLDRVWNEGAGIPDKPAPPGPRPPGPNPGPKPDTHAELVVTVRTLDGKPVDKAKVSAGAAGSRYTGKDGVADFGTVPPGTYDVIAEKEGHGKTRNGPVVKDEKKAVAVPLGSRTAVSLIQHPDCANVAFFEGPANGISDRYKYFGFDHKTNLPVTGGHPYWDPVPAKGSLSMPGDKLQRDGARWVSVGIGLETEVEINFAFKDAECIPCIGNCTYQVIPGNVAEVLTTRITAKKASFRIKGKAAGEATLKVVCDGKDIGWFHIWCKQEKILRVSVVTIVTSRVPNTAYSPTGLRDYMNEIYRQAVVKIDLVDRGSVDLSADAALSLIEAKGYPPGGGAFLTKSGTPRPYDSKMEVLNALHAKATAALKKKMGGVALGPQEYVIYRYVPPVEGSLLGTVLNIGGSVAFSFRGDNGVSRNTIAHEFGHCLTLRHPSDGSGTAQYPAHLLASINQPVTAGFPATNTEPAIASYAADSNVMAVDPTNLMGYWWDEPNTKPLRYLQWKVLQP